MHLISLKDGTFINPAHVVQFTRYRKGQVRFLLSTGGDITGEPWGEDIEELFVPTFPANPGFVAVFADRVKDGDVTYRHRSIIAWRRCPAGNYPMFEGCQTDEDYEVIIDPDGGVFDADGNVYAALDEWKTWFEEEFATTQEAA